jgi:hypothetical protein
MKNKTSTHKGYNEQNPRQPKGAFSPDSAGDKRPLSKKPKKEKPAVAEKKLAGKR